MTVLTLIFFTFISHFGFRFKPARSFSITKALILSHIVAGHLQRGSAIRWREDIEMDVAKISGGASKFLARNKTNLNDTIDG